MQGDLSGRKVVVVGGTGNVGKHLVAAVLSAGAVAVVPSRSAEKLQALERTLDVAVRDRFVPEIGDITDPDDAGALIEQHDPIDGAVASLGGFVAAPNILEAPASDLRRTLDGYVMAHFRAVKNLLPTLRVTGGGYVMINGPLAFDPFRGGGLVSIATAAQAMLARVLFDETSSGTARVNEVVIYSSFGWGHDEANEVTGADIGRYVTFLLSDSAAEIHGQSIHLRSRSSITTARGPGAVPPSDRSNV